MKSLLLIISTFLLCFSAPAQDTTTQASPKAELATFMGIVYVGMPKEDLEKVVGLLPSKNYRNIENEEWITYSNWTTEEPDDLVTFYIVDGKVKGWKVD